METQSSSSPTSGPSVEDSVTHSPTSKQQGPSSTTTAADLSAFLTNPAHTDTPAASTISHAGCNRIDTGSFQILHVNHQTTPLPTLHDRRRYRDRPIDEFHTVLVDLYMKRQAEGKESWDWLLVFGKLFTAEHEGIRLKDLAEMDEPRLGEALRLREEWRGDLLQAIREFCSVQDDGA